MAHYGWGVTVEGSWGAARAADGAQPRSSSVGRCQGTKRAQELCLCLHPPSPYHSLQQGGHGGGLIKESVGSPPAVGVVGDWATDSPGGYNLPGAE